MGTKPSKDLVASETQTRDIRGDVGGVDTALFWGG